MCPTFTGLSYFKRNLSCLKDIIFFFKVKLIQFWHTLSYFGTCLSYFEPDLTCFHRVYPTLSLICPIVLWSFVLPYLGGKGLQTPDLAEGSCNSYFVLTPISIYRVSNPSCHPRTRKNTESWTGHPLKLLSSGLATPENGRVQNLPPLNSPKFWTL